MTKEATKEQTNKPDDQQDTSKSTETKKSAAHSQESSESSKEPNDGYVRLLAEFENFKKRTEREQQHWVSYIKRDLILSLLPVLDDFALALNHEKEAITSQDKGIHLVHKKLVQALEKQGLKAMEAKIGDPFDTKKHEALATTPNKEGSEKDTIAQIVHQGYLLDHEIIRFAKVIVNA